MISFVEGMDGHRLPDGCSKFLEMRGFCEKSRNIDCLQHLIIIARPA
jgi:hypothetical protein